MPAACLAENLEQEQRDARDRSQRSGWCRSLDRGRAALRLAAVALGVGLVMAAGAARAGDDDEDDKTFEEKIIEGIMTGIGGTNMENRGIDYRERSPLVVPPKLDLPPPAGRHGRSEGAELAERSRRAAPQGRDRGPQEGQQGSDRSEPRPDAERTRGGKTAGTVRTSSDPVQPGNPSTTRSSARRSSAIPAGSAACSAATRPRRRRSRASRRGKP